MNYKLGFIGAGNMATAIFAGALKKGLVESSDIYVYDIDQDKLKRGEKQYEYISCSSIDELCEKAQMLVIAVKPNVAVFVLEQMKKAMDLPVISIVTGLSYQTMAEKNAGTLLRFFARYAKYAAYGGAGSLRIC